MLGAAFSRLPPSFPNGLQVTALHKRRIDDEMVVAAVSDALRVNAGAAACAGARNEDRNFRAAGRAGVQR